MCVRSGTLKLCYVYLVLFILVLEKNPFDKGSISKASCFILQSMLLCTVCSIKNLN